MRLLQVTSTLDPEYGGPPVVLNQITKSLNALGHVVDVATLDAPTSPWLRDAPGEPRAFGPAVGRYGYSPRLRRWLSSRVRDYDAVLVHGVWQYQSRVSRALCRGAGVPYFVFVHGALDPWFERRYPAKHVKKALYWRLVEHRVLRDARSVLFTQDEERELAGTSFSPYRAVESVVGIGIDGPTVDSTSARAAFLSAFPELHGKRLVLFLSRLHPKKGCDLLIRAFAAVCRHDPELHLVMAGPDEAGTRTALLALSETLGVDDRITWTGMLSGEVKWGAYFAADVFALVSHSENFGIVIPEALACGLPVLITDKVNIWRVVDGAGAGLTAADDEEGAIHLLREWLALTTPERDAMRARARKCFDDNYEARSAAAAFVDLLSQRLRSDR